MQGEGEAEGREDEGSDDVGWKVFATRGTGGVGMRGTKMDAGGERERGLAGGMDGGMSVRGWVSCLVRCGAVKLNMKL